MFNKNDILFKFKGFGTKMQATGGKISERIRRLNNKQKLFAGACAVSVLAVSFAVIPVKLTTNEQSISMYDGNGIDEDSVSVSLTSLAGVKYRTEDFTVKDNGDGTAVITHGIYTSQIPIRVIPVQSVVAEMVGNAYEGVDVGEKDVEVSVVYSDGTTMPAPENTINEVLSDMEEDGNDKVSVHTDMGDASITVPVIDVSGVRAEYNKKLYEHEEISKQDVEIFLSYADGHEAPCEKYDVDVQYNVSDADITAHTEYGDASCSVPIINVSSITASCSKAHMECDEVDEDEITCNVMFNDGRIIEDEPFTSLNGTIYASTDCDNILRTAYGDTTVQIDIVPINKIDMQLSTDDPYEDDVVHVTKILLTYEDGTTSEIAADEIDGEEYVLRNGDNEISTWYHGKELTTVVTAKPNTNVRMALMDQSIQNEIDSAIRSYVDDTIIACVNEYNTESSHYYLTHIIINEPQQMCAGLSYDTYGGTRETPTSASERMGWVVGINGSNFSYSTGTPDPNMANVRIKQGQLMPDSGAVSNGMEICLLPNGTLFSPPEGMTADDLLAMGVTDTYCCGDTLLVNHGNAVNVGIQSNQYRYPRTAIGMVRPCEYIVVTAGGDGYEKGMTYDEVRDVLMSNGCVFGKCMDGGGSSTLVFQNEMINEPATSEERAVVDFLYWVK